MWYAFFLNGAEVWAAVPDGGIPGSSPADRSFWDDLAKSVEIDLSAGLEPGIPPSGSAAQTSAPS